MRSIRSSWGIAILAAVPFLSSSPAFSTVLQGSFTIVGLEDVQIGETTINWGQQPDDFSTAIGDVFFPTGTGSFASFSATNGTIRDLNYATEPVNMDLLFNNFLVA